MKKTRHFKVANCAKCKLADKRKLKTGEPHCKSPGKVTIKNGICQERKV